MKNSSKLLAGTAVVFLIGIAGAAYYISTRSPQQEESSNKTATATATAKKPSGDAKDESTDDKTLGADYANNRYGFNVSYPEGWTEQASQNGDGATITPSGTQNVFIKVYGFTNSELKPADEIYADFWASAKASYTDLTEVEKNKVLLDDHPATEAVWTYRNSPDGALWKKKMVISLKGEAVCVLELQAEADVYSQQVVVFDQMVKEYKIK